MTELPNDSGMCQETSGFLFSHPCDRFATQKCNICQKLLCDDHGHDLDNQVICTTCLRGQRTAVQTGDPNQARRRDRTYYDPYYDDPFYYREHYYYSSTTGASSTTHHAPTTPIETPPVNTPQQDGTFSGGSDFDDDESSHDPSDFTEGDADSVRHEGDDHFETDMGGS